MSLCRVCRGAGNIGPHGFMWQCPACGGGGATIVYSAPTIRCHPIRFDFWRKQAAKAARKAQGK